MGEPAGLRVHSPDPGRAPRCLFIRLPDLPAVLSGSLRRAGDHPGTLRLRETRLRPLYDQVVPSLVAVARLIGRSFAAQGSIAVFNTLLTFLMLRLLGLQNELLLCVIVLLASFISVLGVILSAAPMTLQALPQPD